MRERKEKRAKESKREQKRERGGGSLLDLLNRFTTIVYFYE
jgi:hypothetical protein